MEQWIIVTVGWIIVIHPTVLLTEFQQVWILTNMPLVIDNMFV